MTDSTRKPMKDIIVPQNDVVRRPNTLPEQSAVSLKGGAGSRIEKNPFFDKLHHEESIPVTSKKGGMRGVFWALLLSALLLSGFFIANYFATAIVDIVPITRSATLDNEITAQKGERGGELGFDFVTLSEEKTKEVVASVEKKIQKKSSGKVVIFNAYNTESQRLIKNTRLESPERKIFHIDQSVVVPGVKMIDGKSIPGSVEVLVYADAAGKEYNIGTTNFTIPGFKGDPRYAKFYAASKADSPIMGGFSGLVRVPSDEAIAHAVLELKDDLKKSVVENVRANIPPGRSFFPGSTVVKFEEVPQEFTAEDTAKVSMRATASVFFFDTAQLTAKVAELSLVEDKTNPFVISNMNAFEFSFVDAVDTVVLSDISKIKFKLTGQAEFVGQIDAKKIQTALAGKSKKDFTVIISNEKNIGIGTKATVWPIWKTEFPSNGAKITINIIAK